MRRGIAAYAPALLWAGVVAYVGGVSDLHGPAVDLPIDKVAHFFMYGVLGALAAWGWQRSGKRWAWWWPLLAVWLLGGWDEWRQREVHGRTSDVTDWIADVAGALAAFAAFRAKAGKERERGGDEPDSIDVVP